MMIANRELLRQGVERLSEIPVAFDWLRWMLEGGFRKHRQLIHRSLGSCATRVLDCGCGTGIYARCFQPSEYVGIDVSAAYIKRARCQYPGYRFEVMDALSMQFADASFDTVIISGVIHHLEDAQSNRLLKEVHRVLRPYGRLLLWEDIPTRSTWNIVGSMVHRLDMGDFIRDQAAYEAMLSGMFEIERTECFRSGFMDYVALAARRLSRTIAEVEPQMREHSLASHLPVAATTSMGWMHAGNPME